MKRKLIYVSTAYSGETATEITRNVMYAWEVTSNLWKLYGDKAFFLVPVLNSAYMDSCMNYNEWLEADLDVIDKVDAVLVISTQVSKGVEAEIEYAKSKEIPVLYSSQQLEEFLKGGENSKDEQ